jgi:hypothetical protein
LLLDDEDFNSELWELVAYIDGSGVHRVLKRTGKTTLFAVWNCVFGMVMLSLMRVAS